MKDTQIKLSKAGRTLHQTFCFRQDSLSQTVCPRTNGLGQAVSDKTPTGRQNTATLLSVVMASDDDEVAAAIYYFLCLEEENYIHRNWWVHPLNQKRNLTGFINELREDPKKFRNFTRISIESFEHVLNLIKFRIQKNNTYFRKSIPPEERLLITLR